MPAISFDPARPVDTARVERESGSDVRLRDRARDMVDTVKTNISNSSAATKLRQVSEFVRAHGPERFRRTELSGDALAAAVANGYAKRLELLPEPRTESVVRDSPVPEIAQAMADGRYDATMQREIIQKLTGVDIGPDGKFPEGTKFLFVVPPSGYWSSELTLIHQMLKTAGAGADFITTDGRQPVPYGVSYTPGFADESYNAVQVSPGEAALGKQYITEAQRQQSDSLDREGAEAPDLGPVNENARLLESPLKLTDIPTLPRPHEGEAARAEYATQLAESLKNFDGYSGMVLVGGGGALNDLSYNPRLDALINYFNRQQKPLVGICYGALPLAQAKDPITNKSILSGRAATGHDRTDDYMVNSALMAGMDQYAPTGTGTAGHILHDELLNAVGRKGGYVGRFDTPLLGVADGHIFTGLTTPDGLSTGALLLARMLGNGQLPERFVVDGNSTGAVPKRSEMERLSWGDFLAGRKDVVR